MENGGKEGGTTGVRGGRWWMERHVEKWMEQQREGGEDGVEGGVEDKAGEVEDGRT